MATSKKAMSADTATSKKTKATAAASGRRCKTAASATKSAAPVKKTASAKVKHIGLVKNDTWLEPYEEAIVGRHQHALYKLDQLTNGGKQTLSDFASGYLYFGLHKAGRGWVLREWAPNATEIYVIGQFNDWKEDEAYKMTRIDNGNWEIKLRATQMHHGDLYKLKVKWEGGEGERIPSYANRVVQDEVTKIFSAQVWAPAQPYEFKKTNFKPNTNPLLIYECHVGPKFFITNSHRLHLC